jgi:hypothetical protein
MQQVPITLTLGQGASLVDYPAQDTDAGGSFTVSVGSMSGLYNWRVKSPKYLANAGTVTLSGAETTAVEMDLMLTGDTNNDNIVSISDFVLLSATFGKTAGESGYDDRADFTGDRIVSSADFILLKINFSRAGAPPLGP